MAEETTLPHPAPAPEPAKQSIFSGGLGAKPATTAAARLRAFEDKHLGKDAIRNMRGVVERGYGSPFKRMSPELHAEHAALEKLVAAEEAVDAANAALSSAKAAHAAAEADVDAAAKVSDAAAAK